MAYELVQEVLDHAPEDLDPGARLVLVCIAEECRGGSRMREIPSERLQRRTGLGARGLRDACKRLEARGIKVRVAMSVDRHNKPVYAVPGRSCQWVLPPLAPPDGCMCMPCSHKEEAKRLLREEEERQLQQAEPQLQQTEPQRRQAEPQLPPNHPFPFPSGGTVTDIRAYARAVAAKAQRDPARRLPSSGVPFVGTPDTPSKGNA